MSLGPGSTIGPFKIQSLLGKGGMGEVFSALDTRLDRKVALKILPPDFASDSDRLRRFQSEAKTLASLNHPNILVIHEVGAENTNPYLVSELLEGRTLREELANGPLPIRKAIDFALQIGHGLAAAHARSMIHRDLKPENIFITKDGRVKILDFGLAKPCSRRREEADSPDTPSNPPRHVGGYNDATLLESTVPGLTLGTPAYMSPEQVRGEPVDHRSDIFSFGCVLYEMLSGSRAFQRDTAVESMNAVLKEPALDLAAQIPPIAPVLVQVVERCLEKHPDNRFQSVQDLAFALHQLGASNEPSTPLPRRVTTIWLRTGFASAFLLLAGLAFWQVGKNPRANSVLSVDSSKSVAVRPFDNRSADQADEYLSDGLTEELLNALVKIKGLRVPGRSSSFAFKSRNEEGLIRRMGEQLNVGAVLEASGKPATSSGSPPASSTWPTVSPSGPRPTIAI